MAGSERAVIFVESGSELPKSRGTPSGSKERTLMPKMQDKGNYVIKIHIGDESMYNPVRIDVSTGKSSRIGLEKSTILEEEATFSGSSSGQSSPRSDMTPPPRINPGSIRFGSETSESDTESDVSSEYRPPKCPTAQFAMREMLEIEPLISAPSPVLSNNGHQFSQLRRQESPHAQTFKEIAAFGPNLLNTRSNMSLQRSYSHSRTSSLLSENARNDQLNLDNNDANKGDRSFCNTLDLARKNLLKTATFMDNPAQQVTKLQKQEEIRDENGFHLDEINDSKAANEATDSLNNFAGYKDIFARTKQDGPAQIMSEKGTIRGVKNRVRDGIATFLQTNDIKNFSEKEQGRVVVYLTSMGVVRDTFMRCQKVKQILRTLLVKFDERDCYMNRSIQTEIRQRLPPRAYASASKQADGSCKKYLQQSLSTCNVPLPQVFLEGQHLGDAETIEKLNETGELRDILRPYKSLSVLNTCDRCGGFRMLPCPICNGSKKSVHRNHFTTEFVALKCMHCDPSGLVSCDLCNGGGGAP